MPPKKAKKKGKEIVIGGYSIEQMTESELQMFATKLQEELTRSNFDVEFIESEKVVIEETLEKAKNSLAEKNKVFLAKTEELRDLKVTSRKLLNEMNQKVENVAKENLSNALDTLAHSNMKQFQRDEDNLNSERNAQLRIQRKEIAKQEEEMAYNKLFHSIQKTRYDEISLLIQNQEIKINRVTAKYEKIFDDLWKDINQKRLALLKEAEDSRMVCIKELDNKREKEFLEVRDYFTRISFDCLLVVEELKAKLEKAKKSARDEKYSLKQAVVENSRLVHAQEEIEESNKSLDSYESDKKKFSKNRKIMLEFIQKIKDLELENYMLVSKFQHSKKKKEDMEIQFIEAIKRLQQSVTLKSVYKEQQLKNLLDLLEHKKQVQHHSLPEAKDTTKIIEKKSLEKIEEESDIAETVDRKVNVVFRKSPLIFKPPLLPEI